MGEAAAAAAAAALGVHAAYAERLRRGPGAAGDAAGAKLAAPRPGGQHVLYVVRTALRSRGNPSLEVALTLANALRVPCVCVCVLEDSFPPQLGRKWRPTDRAARFRLEALRELQPEFAQRGTCLWVSVERDGCRAAVCMSLAAKAAVVVADEHHGVEPHLTAARKLAQTGAPLWLCDTACTVPCTIVAAPAKALGGGNAGFLRATAALRTARLRAGWFPPPTRCAAPAAPAPPAAPAWSVDLSGPGAIDAVLAAPSRRDAAVEAVRHTLGGGSRAEERWRQFVRGGGLKTYAAHRNNPLHADGRGASRMSAYVNAGMIDPHAMARDAAAASDKYFSEFVGFRETAHLWCFAHPGGHEVAAAAVPDWTRGQLRAPKKRPGAPVSVADLEAGRTGDALWDDCQRSLALSGELHNNLRMAWGKAIPKWTATGDLQDALDLLIRLNDKYALDGGAPPSYGGLLWCLGWRDRPGSGGRPKARPTSVMAKKFKPGDLVRRARAKTRAPTLFFAVGTEQGKKRQRAEPAGDDRSSPRDLRPAF